MTRHRKDLGAAVIRPAEREERVRAVVDDPGPGGKGLGVVDGRRLAVQPEARRKGRLEARQALLAFERLEERRFLAADIGAVAVVVVEFEGKSAAEDVFSD